MPAFEAHSTAIIAPGAVIGEGTNIGPYSLIGPHVVIGRNNRIAGHVIIEGYTTIGDRNEIFQFASIGSRPQDLKFKDEKSKLVIGNANIIREYVTIQPGTEGGGMLTSVGDKNLFMANCHLGHDGNVGNANVIANSCALAGHVTIGSHAILGGLSAVHQFVRVGDYAMIGGGAMLTLDLIPCGVAQGDRAKMAGINAVGLERAGFSSEAVSEIKNLYRALFVRVGNFADKVKEAQQGTYLHPMSQAIISFITSSTRGLAMPRSRRGE